MTAVEVLARHRVSLVHLSEDEGYVQCSCGMEFFVLSDGIAHQADALATAGLLADDLRKAVEPCATLLYALDDELTSYEEPRDIDADAVRDAIQTIAECFRVALGGATP